MTDAAATAAARRVVLLVVAALAAAAGAAIVVVAGGMDDGSDAEVAAAVDQLGPRPGNDVAPYLVGRQEVLRDIDARAVVVVSFTSYVPAAEVDGLLGDDIDADAVLVAMPGGAPAITTDPSEFRARAVADARAQLSEIRALLPTVDDEEFAGFYRAEIVRYETVVAAADRADIVFGAVVRSTGPRLRALAGRPGVRLVDATAGTALAEGADVSGLRPEEVDRTGTPEFRPA